MKISQITPVYIASPELELMTRNLLLESLVRNYANNSDLEIILVDDFSPIQNAAENLAKEYRNKGLNIKSIRLNRRSGYSSAVNAGAMESKGDLLLITNNDIYIPQNIIFELADRLNKNKLGAIGTTLSNAHGYKAQSYKRTTKNYTYEKIDYDNFEKQAKEIKSEFNNLTIDVNYIMGAFMMVPRRIFDEAGNMDTAFGLGYYEEVDLEARIRRLGYKMAVARDLFVIHQQISPSFSTIGQLNRKVLLSKNSVLFLIKNGFKENKQLNFDWFKRTCWNILNSENKWCYTEA